MKSYQEKEIIRLYVEEQRGQAYCARKAKSNIREVKKVLRKNHIPIRDFYEANPTKNIDFFKKENSRMAYMTGFLIAAASLSEKTNKISVTVPIEKIDLLISLQDALEIKNEIKFFRTSTGEDRVKLRWSCKNHQEFLTHFNLEDLSEDYQQDFNDGFYTGSSL